MLRRFDSMAMSAPSRAVFAENSSSPVKSLKMIGREAEHVALGPHGDAALANLLRRGVARRPTRHADEGPGATHRPRDAEIRDLEDLVVAEATAEHVVGAEVAVHHADFVDGFEPAREASNRQLGPLGIERVARSARR